MRKNDRANPLAYFIRLPPSVPPITVHAYLAPVAVRNMAGPAQVTAIHARATLLNTIGKVDATAFVLDLPVLKEL
jgi:hypothetical protein